MTIAALRRPLARLDAKAETLSQHRRLIKPLDGAEVADRDDQIKPIGAMVEGRLPPGAFPEDLPVARRPLARDWIRDLVAANSLMGLANRRDVELERANAWLAAVDHAAELGGAPLDRPSSSSLAGKPDPTSERPRNSENKG
jgi:hypothetical protein